MSSTDGSTHYAALPTIRFLSILVLGQIVFGHKRRVLGKSIRFQPCCTHTSIFLFYTMTNKCTIISQIITLLHVSTLSCLPQGACNQYLAKLYEDYNMRNFIKPVWNILTVNCITDSSIWNSGVTWQGIDYKLSEDDTVVSKHVAMW